MSDQMGMLRITVEVQALAESVERRRFESVLVDTGSELSWFPALDLEALGVQRTRLLRFRQATGVIVERWTGVAAVTVQALTVGDTVAFAEPGDLVLLGCRTLEGLNFVFDPVNRRLVDAGAMPAAVAA